MKLHYKSFGEGTPLIILHGLFGCSDNWVSIAKRLSDYFKVFIVDQRNHGHSSWSENMSYAEMSEDLKELYENLDIKEAIVMGHSMGGKTILQFNNDYPNMVKKMIVVDMGIKAYPPHHTHIIDAINAIDLNSIFSRREVEAKLRNQIESNEIVQFLLKNLYWVEKGQLGLRINLPVLKENVSEVGEALATHAVFENETLFLRGDKSEYIGPSDEAIISRHFPNSKLVTISNAGHWLHAENPNAFYKAVIEFIQ